MCVKIPGNTSHMPQWVIFSVERNYFVLALVWHNQDMTCLVDGEIPDQMASEDGYAICHSSYELVAKSAKS